MRAGAGLTVLWSANSGITEEAGSALLTELPLSVMQAALVGETYHVCMSVCLYNVQHSQYQSGASYRADASLRVAGVRVPIAFTELAVAQI